VKPGKTTQTRLGFLGPAIVIAGAVIAGLLIWFMQTQRPIAGDVIDTIAIDATHSIVLRKEAKSDRSFIELREGAKVKWQALIPHYAGAPGRPAVAWCDGAVTVRVERDGRAEVFAFGRTSAQKLGTLRLAPEHEPIEMHASGPISLSDHAHPRSYELVGGTDWHQVFAIDLSSGSGLWIADLGASPIEAAGIDGPNLWISQAGRRRTFDAATGREQTADKPLK
jgi:hypothetical protein